MTKRDQRLDCGRFVRRKAEKDLGDFTLHEVKVIRRTFKVKIPNCAGNDENTGCTDLLFTLQSIINAIGTSDSML